MCNIFRSEYNWTSDKILRSSRKLRISFTRGFLSHAFVISHRPKCWNNLNNILTLSFARRRITSTFTVTFRGIVFEITNAKRDYSTWTYVTGAFPRAINIRKSRAKVDTLVTCGRRAFDVGMLILATYNEFATSNWFPRLFRQRWLDFLHDTINVCLCRLYLAWKLTYSSSYSRQMRSISNIKRAKFPN